MKEKDKPINIFEPFFCDFTIESVERVDDFLIKMNFKNPPGLVAFYNDVTEDVTFNAKIFGLNYLNNLKKDVKERFNFFKEETKYKIKTKGELHSNLYSLYLNGEVNKYPENEKWIGNSLTLYFNSNFIRVLFNPFETDEDNRFICQIQSLNLSTGLYDYFGEEDYVTCCNTIMCFAEEEWDLLKTTIEDYYMDAVE